MMLKDFRQLTQGGVYSGNIQLNTVVKGTSILPIVFTLVYTERPVKTGNFFYVK